MNARPLRFLHLTTFYPPYSFGATSMRCTSIDCVTPLVMRDTRSMSYTAISRTRRLIDVETHRAVFTWVQARLVAAGLLKGRTVAIDATTLEANAAMRSIVRRDTGDTYQAYLTRLAAASGIRRRGRSWRGLIHAEEEDLEFGPAPTIPTPRSRG